MKVDERNRRGTVAQRMLVLQQHVGNKAVQRLLDAEHRLDELRNRVSSATGVDVTDVPVRAHASDVPSPMLGMAYAGEVALRGGLESSDERHVAAHELAHIALGEPDATSLSERERAADAAGHRALTQTSVPSGTHRSWSTRPSSTVLRTPHYFDPRFHRASVVNALAGPSGGGFTAEEIGEGETPFKCAPPNSERRNREALWQGIHDGTITMVVSDHSPCTPQLKKLDVGKDQGSFMAAWGGIAGLQLGLSALWTEAKGRGLSLLDVVRLHSESTAALAGVADRKGRIAAGFDADLVVWDDRATFTVDPKLLKHRHQVTPWAGRTLSGVVEATIVGGRVAYSGGAGLTTRPPGRLLTVSR